MLTGTLSHQTQASLERMVLRSQQREGAGLPRRHTASRKKRGCGRRDQEKKRPSTYAGRRGKGEGEVVVEEEGRMEVWREDVDAGPSSLSATPPPLPELQTSRPSTK